MTIEVGAVVVAAVVATTLACSTSKIPTPTAPNLPTSLNGEWLFSVSAGPACAAELPTGYGLAPMGGGRAILRQEAGSRGFTGELQIFGAPSGTIGGVIDGRSVEFTFTLDGRNQGVVHTGDELCKVKGSGTAALSATQKGLTTTCHVFGKFTGDFSCPHMCKPPAESYLMLTKGCS